MLAWLLGEPRSSEVADALKGSAGVIASDITLIECERVLIRAWNTGLLSEAERIGQSSDLARVAAHWTQLRVDEDVVERARRPFPLEPIRTLDALHLASALVARSVAPGLVILTLDQRVRENAVRLGFQTVP